MKADVRILTGSAGSGKSKKIYEELVDLAAVHPEQRFYLIVPEQAGSSMEQRILAVNRERTGRAGFFNIDIIGFTRLAYRIFEEQGRSMRQVLEDYGKTILLRSVVGKVRSELELYSGSVDRQGFIDELKSLFSEFLMFDISPGELEKAMNTLPESGLHLQRKLKDVLTIYRAFREDSAFLEQYMVAEELPAYLARLLTESGEVRTVDGCTFYFDGFTGYTAAQRKVLECLICRAKAMTFTITLDPEDTGNPMFEQSTEMLEQLLRMAPGAELQTQPEPPADTPLRFLTKHVFRFPVREYVGGPGEKKGCPDRNGSGEIAVWRTVNSVEELRVAAEDIRDRVRRGQQKGQETFRYRDAAILTADPDGIAGYVDMVMREYGLPYFTDRTRTFVNNPIIDAQLFVLEMLDRDFTYESVFAFLKTGVLDRAVQELGLEAGCAEWLENFVIAHGIRGKKLWQKPVEHFAGRKAEKERTEAEENQLEQMEELRQLMLSVLEPVLGFSGGKQYPVERMIRGLSELAEDPRLGLSERGKKAEYDLTEMGYPAEARAYSGIYEKYLSVLEKTQAILGERKMSLHELRETLLIGVREIRIGVIPPTLDCVLIGDLVRTRIGEVKVLYVIGFNEGILPRPKNSGGLLSDRDRSRLEEALECAEGAEHTERAEGAERGPALNGADRSVSYAPASDAGKKSRKHLAPDETKKRFQEQFALYLAFSKPTQRLVITYAEKSKSAQEMEKSFLLGRIERLFPDLREERRIRKQISGNVIPDRLEYMRMLQRMEESPEDRTEMRAEEKILLCALEEVFPEIPRTQERTGQGTESLPPELMKRLKIRVSVSQLEKYANCPYAYFLRYILKLAPRRTHLMRELDVGEILHKTLELVFRRVKQEHKNDWKNLPQDMLLTLVRQAVGDAVREKKPELLEEENRDGKTEITLDQIGELAETTAEMLKMQLSGSKLLPEVMEGNFSAEFEAKTPDGELETVKINGVIDRLDTWISPEDGTTCLRILDYKTGDRKMDLRDLRDGRNLQLTVYLRILTEIFRRKMTGSQTIENPDSVMTDRDRPAVIPAGMYYYHVDQPVLTQLGKSFGSEEEAARAEMEKSLKLRGVPNLSPDRDGGIMPKHFLIELQDPEAVDEDRNLKAAKVLPIKVAKTSGASPTEGSVLATTELMEGIGDYAVFKMKDMTEQILRGDIRKYPARVDGSMKNACEYCDSAAVCRFRKGESKENYVPKADSQDAVLVQLAESGRKKTVSLKNPQMGEEPDVDVLLDTLREDTDGEDSD